MNPQAETRPVLALPWKEACSAASGYYRWDDAASSLSVKISLRAVEEILQDALQGFGFLPRRGAEVGGLLLGAVEGAGSRRCAVIHGFESIPCEYAFGPSYVLSLRSEAYLLEALARRRHSGEEDRQVVGFYRSHTRKGLFLSPHDVAFLKKFFPDPASVFLLVKPYLTRTSEGGYFLWESVRRNPETPAHEFPFCREHLERKPVRAAAGSGNGPLAGASGVTPFPLELPSSGRQNGNGVKPRKKSSYARALRYLEFVDQEIREAAQSEASRGEIHSESSRDASPQSGGGAPWIQDVLADSLASLRNRAMVMPAPAVKDVAPAMNPAAPGGGKAAPEAEKMDALALEPVSETDEVALEPQPLPQGAIPAALPLSGPRPCDTEGAGQFEPIPTLEPAARSKEAVEFMPVPLPEQAEPLSTASQPEMLVELLPVNDLLAVAEAAGEPAGVEPSAWDQGEVSEVVAAELSSLLHLAKGSLRGQTPECFVAADATTAAPDNRETDSTTVGDAVTSPGCGEGRPIHDRTAVVAGVSTADRDEPLRRDWLAVESVQPEGAIEQSAACEVGAATLQTDGTATKREWNEGVQFEAETPAATTGGGDDGTSDPVGPLLKMLAEATATSEGRNPEVQTALPGLTSSDRRLWCFRGKWLPLILLIALSGAVSGYFTGKASGAAGNRSAERRLEQVVQLRSGQIAANAE